jgi:hypothetical protein
MAVADAMLVMSAMSRKSSLLPATEMAGEFQMERALLLVVTVVLAANEVESRARRREGKGVVPHPCPHSSIIPPHISVLPPTWFTWRVEKPYGTVRPGADRPGMRMLAQALVLVAQAMAVAAAVEPDWYQERRCL